MEEDDLKKILKEDIPQEVDIECDSKELLSKCKQKSKQRNKKVLRVSLVISSIVVVFLLGFSITLITNNSLNSNNRKNMGGDYKDTHEPTEPIATEPITTEPIKTEPTQTEEIGFNVTINIGDKVITYNDIKSLSIEDIEEIDHYQYLGLYLDSEFTQTFTGEISNDTTLYMDYIIFYNVIIKNIGDDINIHVNSNDDIDYKTFNMPSNKIFSGLYLDSEFTQEFTGKVNSDLVLYAKINMLYNVKVYLDNELVDDTMVLENEKYEGTIIESNPRYKEIKLYTDSLCTNEYNKEDTVNSDLTLYYGYTLNEEYNDLAIVRIHVGENVSRIEVPKGSSLGYYDLLFASHANSFGFSLFLDKECTKSYKYGPIENDLDLYQLETIPIIDYVIIDLYYWLDDNTSLGSVTISNARGEGLLLTEIGVYFNYVIEGVYIDREMTIKYNEEPINDRTNLYVKMYKEVPVELNVHKVTIYMGPTMQTGIANETINKDNLYREFYILDGTYIAKRSFRIANLADDLLLYDLYYYDTLEAYKFEPITEDTVFFIVNGGMVYHDGNYPEDKFTKYELIIGDEIYKLKIMGNRTSLSSYDFLCKYDIYLDSDYTIPYTGGYSFEKLYLK